MTLPDLAAVLWRQRELMEQLAHRLECEQLLMVSGRTARLGLAVADVEKLVDHLQLVEMQRAQASDRAGAALGLPPEAGLAELSMAAGPPWNQLLMDHRAALIELGEELRVLGDTTRRLAGGAVDAVQVALNHLGVTSQATAGVGYDASGRSDTGLPRLRMAIDRVM